MGTGKDSVAPPHSVSNGADYAKAVWWTVRLQRLSEAHASPVNSLSLKIIINDVL